MEPIILKDKIKQTIMTHNLNITLLPRWITSSDPPSRHSYPSKCECWYRRPFATTSTSSPASCEIKPERRSKSDYWSSPEHRTG